MHHYIYAPNDTNVKHINLMQKIKTNTIMITCDGTAFGQCGFLLHSA